MTLDNPNHPLNPNKKDTPEYKLLTKSMDLFLLQADYEKALKEIERLKGKLLECEQNDNDK